MTSESDTGMSAGISIEEEGDREASPAYSFRNFITFEFNFSSFLLNLYAQNTAEYGVSETLKVFLPESKSKLIGESGGILSTFVVKGLAGAFNKDKGNEFGSIPFGRALCDMIKLEYNCNGFFTSDELPRYGISRKDKRNLVAQVQSKTEFNPQTDLIVIMGYHDAHLIEKIKYNLNAKFKYLLGIN
jgi:Glu-tRNA(Gln) amidotransferase subunit E-like FAD-binding protein